MPIFCHRTLFRLHTPLSFCCLFGLLSLLWWRAAIDAYVSHAGDRRHGEDPDCCSEGIRNLWPRLNAHFHNVFFMSGKRVMYVLWDFGGSLKSKSLYMRCQRLIAQHPSLSFCKLADRRCVKRHLLKNILLSSPIAFISSESELKEVKGEFTAGKTVF